MMHQVAIKVVRPHWWSRRVVAFVGVQREEGGNVLVKEITFGRNDYLEINEDEL